MVKSVALSSDGDRIIEAVGVSEFLRGRRIRFLEELEKKDRKRGLQVLKPEETHLVIDETSGYVRSLLFVEANLKQTIPEDGRIYWGHKAAMDALNYQLIPATKALQMPRQRLLIADAVGLGKTLECGILVTELIGRGKGRRILVVTTKSMMGQFQKEFWLRFTIPLVRLDSGEIQRVRSRLPGNHNPFHYYDRTIISIDTLKQDREYRSYLEQAHWDIIIIDEAHNVARRGKGQSASQRAKLAERLATRSDTLILLSATPHDGKPESFASLMNMLDPTAIANESNYTKNDIHDLYLRRFKKDVLRDLNQSIPERNVEPVEAIASPPEEAVFRKLHDLQLVSIDRGKSAGQLFKTTLLKAFLSSPAAGLETVQNRLKTLQKKLDISTELDQAELTDLAAGLAAIDQGSFSKYQRLIQLIKTEFQWTGKDPKDRLVIFTGRLETLRFLEAELPQDLRLKPEAIARLDGGMADIDQVEIVEKFGYENSPVRILIATEVASEGLNLHYLSHKLIHFDIPWSLMTLQQRNGRIDRYGQTRKPEIRYLLTRSQVERMDEVERIIKVLLTKDEQAIKNIGDPSVFMGVFDPEKEENLTAAAIESGVSAADFAEELDRNAKGEGDVDIFSWFESESGDTDEGVSMDSDQGEPLVETGSLLSLFPSIFQFTATALRFINSQTSPVHNLQINEDEGFIELQLPQELKSRYDRLPKEIQPQDNRLLYLSDRPEDMMRAMEQARTEDADWSAVQYLWELHPLVEWISDRCLFYFGRHQAPVIQLSQGLESDEVIFICFGSFPNRRGTSVLNRWVSVIFKQGKFQRVEPFAETQKRTELGLHELPNSGTVNIDDLLPLRSPAIQQARQYLQQERQRFQDQLNPQLEAQRERLERLQGYHVEQLELRWESDNISANLKQDKQQKERHKIDKIFQDYRDWVELSMTTESEPYLKLIFVIQQA
ncbi:DEAD/DEAH box helicase [Arthrospira platensis BEA 1257B]